MRKRHWQDRKNRKCPDCSRMITYTRKDTFDRAVGNNSVCKSCAQMDRRLTLETIEKSSHLQSSRFNGHSFISNFFSYIFINSNKS